jgi:uncharacterized protein YraI
MKARFIVPLVAVGALFAAGAANAETGYTINTFHIFTAPEHDSARIETVPANARVHIFGCLQHRDWCEVAWNGARGWMDSNGLEVFDRGRRVRASDVDMPIVRFRAGFYDAPRYERRYDND